MHFDYISLFNMSINLYTATQAELQSLHGIGTKSASEIVVFRKEVLAGHRDPLTIHDLAKIRLKPETWQQFITYGLLSIIVKRQYRPRADQPELPDEAFGQFDEEIHIKEEFTLTLPAPKQILPTDQPTQQLQIGQIQHNQTEQI